MKKTFLIAMIVLFGISVAFASGIGASLTVLPETETTLAVSRSKENPVIGDTIIFYAEYKAEGVDVTDATVTLDIGGSTLNMNYDISASAYVVSFKFENTGTYIFTVTADKIGYEKQEITEDLYVSPRPVSTSDTGAFPTYVLPRIRFYIDGFLGTHFPVEAGEQIVIFIDSPYSNFEKIEIMAHQTIYKAKINITSIDCPERLSNNEWIPYQCVIINLEELAEKDYEEVSLYFKVSNKWISNENVNISTIRVEKTGVTNEILDVVLVNKDNQFHYFYVTFESFSNFMIYGEQNIEKIEEVIIDETIEEPIEEIPKEEDCLKLFVCWYWWAIGFGMVLIAYTTLSNGSGKIKSPKKKKSKKKKARRKVKKR